jgi:hypothetical protein
MERDLSIVVVWRSLLSCHEDAMAGERKGRKEGKDKRGRKEGRGGQKGR